MKYFKLFSNGDLSVYLDVKRGNIIFKSSKATFKVSADTLPEVSKCLNHFTTHVVDNDCASYIDRFSHYMKDPWKVSLKTEVIRLANLGKISKEIADYVGCDVEVVQSLADKLGLKLADHSQITSEKKKKRNSDYYERNKARLKEKQNSNYQLNKEKIKAKRRQRYAESKTVK